MARAWQSVYFLVTEVHSETYDRLVVMPPMAHLLDRSYQYRVIWDSDRNAWRVDMRADAGEG
jgi:hypothetical protein